jgi:hypothetical protein
MVSRMRLVLAQILAHGRARLRLVRFQLFDCCRPLIRKADGTESSTASESRDRLVLSVNTPHSLILVAEVLGYAALQRDIHHALRAQHPEWIEADGNSPTCDSYESRLRSCSIFP